MGMEISGINSQMKLQILRLVNVRAEIRREVPEMAGKAIVSNCLMNIHILCAVSQVYLSCVCVIFKRKICNN